MTTTTSTPSSSVPPPISSFDPQLLKLLARHHHHFNQQSSAKEFLQHAFYFNHPPPNTVATLSPRHHLSNGLSKLNSENSTANLKLNSSVTNSKLDAQQTLSPAKKPASTPQQQAKDALAFDQWLQPPAGSVIQGPPCIQADTSSSSTTSSATAGSKSETTLSSGERLSPLRPLSSRARRRQRGCVQYADRHRQDRASRAREATDWKTNRSRNHRRPPNSRSRACRHEYLR